MSEYPILYSAPMVRAALTRQKRQTRRVVVPTMTPPRVAPLTMEPWIIDGEQETDDQGRPCWAGFHPDYPGEAKWFSCPWGKVGDRLWVRETLRRSGDDIWYYAADVEPVMVDQQYKLEMLAWAHHNERDYCPSIHMPRWASRLVQTITDVRVERVQSISEVDAQLEGWDLSNLEPYHAYDPVSMTKAREWFAALWDTINAKRGYSWECNPWVWVVCVE